MEALANWVFDNQSSSSNARPIEDPAMEAAASDEARRDDTASASAAVVSLEAAAVRDREPAPPPLPRAACAYFSRGSAETTAWSPLVQRAIVGFSSWVEERSGVRLGVSLARERLIESVFLWRKACERVPRSSDAF